jgi:hypothetical protein
MFHHCMDFPVVSVSPYAQLGSNRSMCCAPILAPFHNPTPALNQMQLICGWFESIDPQVQKQINKTARTFRSLALDHCDAQLTRRVLLR